MLCTPRHAISRMAHLALDELLLDNALEQRLPIVKHLASFAAHVLVVKDTRVVAVGVLA